MKRSIPRTAAAASAVALAVGAVGLIAIPAISSEDVTPASGVVTSATAQIPVVPEPEPKPTSDLVIDRVSPSEGTYGVGITVRVKFNQPVPESARKAALRHITVETSKPIGPAGWAWTDSQTAVFRPKEFWPANTTVEVRTYKTYDVVHSNSERDLLWAGSADQEFRIGRNQEIHVDNATHRATVIRDEATVRTMPVTMGKPGWETRSGTKVLMEGYRVKQMTGDSINAEEDYTLQVPYAIRITDSGEFIHGAPWASGSIGRTNSSHGCTSLSVSDAQWLFSNHLFGDPVITTGTGRGMEPGNGIGGVWNVPWSTWKTGSITSA